jgi:predicted Zn-dependent protease
MQYPKRIRPVSLDFQLMRARVEVHSAQTPEEAVASFRAALQGQTRSTEATTYGLVLALTAAGRPNEAALSLDSIWSENTDRIEYVIADAEIDLARGNPQRAVATLEQRLELSPGNHPLTMAYADALWQAGMPHIASQILKTQSKRKPEDPGLWYRLAEVQGLAGDIIGLHQSRAEYFILVGALDAAQSQLSYALKLVNNNFTQSATINERLRDVMDIREELESS